MTSTWHWDIQQKSIALLLFLNSWFISVLVIFFIPSPEKQAKMYPPEVTASSSLTIWSSPFVAWYIFRGKLAGKNFQGVKVAEFFTVTNTWESYPPHRHFLQVGEVDGTLAEFDEKMQVCGSFFFFFRGFWGRGNGFKRRVKYDEIWWENLWKVPSIQIAVVNFFRNYLWFNAPIELGSLSSPGIFVGFI